jgi:hypothetical protein
VAIGNPFFPLTGIIDFYLDVDQTIRLGITRAGQPEVYIEDLDVGVTDFLHASTHVVGGGDQLGLVRDQITDFAHATSHAAGQNDALFITEAQVVSLVTDLASKSDVSHTHTKANITDLGTIGTAASKNVALTGDATTVQVVMGNDSRLYNNRAPTAHASTHGVGQGDPITIAESQVTNLITDLGGKAPTVHTHAPTLLVQNQGNNVVSTVSRINFVGSGVLTTPLDANSVTVSILGGGGTGGMGVDPSDAPPANIDITTGATQGDPGVLPQWSRGDHRHELIVAPPMHLNPNTTNAGGTANTISRSDHTHGMDLFESTNNRGNPGGYAVLDGSGRVPTEELGSSPAATTYLKGAIAGSAATWASPVTVKSDLGLSLVNNTTDAAKPISDLTQIALNGKSNTGHTHPEAEVTNLTNDLAARSLVGHTHTPAQVGLGSVTNTAPADMPVSGATITAMNALVPAGCIMMWPGPANTVPAGWLLCNGQSTTGYPALAAVVGANVPDMQSRYPMGAGTNRTVKATEGNPTETDRALRFNHSHGHATTISATDGNHYHDASGLVVAGAGAHGHNLDMAATDLNVTMQSNTATTPSGSNRVSALSGATLGNHSHAGSTANTGGSGHAHSVGGNTNWGGTHSHTASTGTGALIGGTIEHPFMALNFIIKY